MYVLDKIFRYIEAGHDIVKNMLGWIEGAGDTDFVRRRGLQRESAQRESEILSFLKSGTKSWKEGQHLPPWIKGIWNFIIFELRDKSWKEGQHPHAQRKFGILSFLKSGKKSWKEGQHPPCTKGIWDFVIFEIRDKSLKEGQHLPPWTKGIWNFVIFEIRKKVGK